MEAADQGRQQAYRCHNTAVTWIVIGTDRLLPRILCQCLLTCPGNAHVPDDRDHESKCRLTYRFGAVDTGLVMGFVLCFFSSQTVHVF